MLLRTGEKENARGIDDQRLGARASDRQDPFSEYVKIPGRFIEDRREATLPARVKHPRGEVESFEERSQGIHNETIRYTKSTPLNLKYRMILKDASGRVKDYLG